MSETLARKLLAAHLVSGQLTPGTEIGLRMEQVLLQDVLGTLVMLELEAMGVTRVSTSPSVQYIDHGLVQSDEINADAHLFLKSACERFGVIYSGPGNGISHPVHMERFGVPGVSLIGSDSHTVAAGSLGMLAIGAGGVEVALAMAGEPFYITAPHVFGVELVGELPDWVSAKDVVLEMLRRHGTSGATNTIIEYYGPGLACLSAMDRHVIANMGAELGATTSVFPSDDAIRRFLEARGRGADFRPFSADPGCSYDRHDRIDLSALEPLIAKPQSPGNVVPVSSVAGEPIYQAYIGSSANPGYRDFAVVADIVSGSRAAEGVSLDINPSSRQVLQTLVSERKLGSLVASGARLHQAGCNGCIGMGQAPASGRNSIRTVPRNFPGRSGTREDSVFLASPETCAASALSGVITDPRTLDRPYPRIAEPDAMPMNAAGFVFPQAGRRPELYRTRHTPLLPDFDAYPDRIEVPVLLALEHDVSTDDIIPAGQILPLWSNVFATADHAFGQVDETYASRTRQADTARSGHAIVAGKNYGQGSSRENAALVPRIMGLRLVVAQSFARIHWQNLSSFGILPLVFVDTPSSLAIGDTIVVEDIRAQLEAGASVRAQVRRKDGTFEPLHLRHDLSERQVDIMTCGGVINWIARRRDNSMERTSA
ncbi:aconitate hydratase [Fulvimarina sp. 2208YS6-2-32]|uniref:Aconitate hydratase n=1 Tax=Fulvimarina uroteuthidis TaxID=3098149 RepID=A0ABU5I1R2_9HYPH|nr:aconitate hydratase [Fulvimarina sp. 2208YS6-2-32]MDY8108759.1 aconitate hydratase [Fulvimarina sp. 2208YS6-2-32]